VHVAHPDVLAKTPAWPIMARAALDELAGRIAEAGSEPDVQLAFRKEGSITAGNAPGLNSGGG
jgi:hypothetical protein